MLLLLQIFFNFKNSALTKIRAKENSINNKMFNEAAFYRVFFTSPWALHMNLRKEFIHYFSNTGLPLVLLYLLKPFHAGYHCPGFVCLGYAVFLGGNIS